MRPVNEYNITDKVKQANQELFETPHPGSPESLNTSTLLQRVTFRQILVDYEPEYTSSDEEDEVESQQGDHHPRHAQIEETEIIEENEIIEETEKQIIEEEITTELPPLNEPQMEEVQEEIEEQLYDNEIKENLSYSESEDCPKETENINLRKLYEAQSTSESKDCDSIIEVMSTLKINSENVQFSGTATITINTLQEESKSSSTALQQNKQSADAPNHSKSSKQTKQKTSKENTKNLQLNLNFRSCCDYKLDDNEKLPRYNGYYSQYGLSRREIEKREKRLQSMRMRQFEMKIKMMEENASKGEQNEEAFASWLKNKMRNPRNRTKNMFDFKGKKKKSKRELK